MTETHCQLLLCRNTMVEDEDEDEVEREGFKQRLLSVQRSKVWLFIESIQCTILLASIVLLFMYVVHMSQNARLKPDFKPYDADGHSNARVLLTARVPVPDQPGIPQSGDPGRWRIAPDTSSGLGLAEVGSMFSDIKKMQFIFIMYTLLQSIAMLIFTIRLLSHLMFQPRLAVFSNTLDQSMHDITHYLMVIVFVHVCLAGILHTLFGEVHPSISSYADAIYTVFAVVLNSDPNKDNLYQINKVG